MPMVEVTPAAVAEKRPGGGTHRGAATHSWGRLKIGVSPEPFRKSAVPVWICWYHGLPGLDAVVMAPWRHCQAFALGSVELK